MALQNCSIWTMKTFLGSNTYHIPDYQREYSWEGDELSDFWEDLKYTKDDPDEMPHFFGQIVVHNDGRDKSNKRKYIIDGQQRTITSVIFLRALQILYTEIGNNDADEPKEEITTYIGRCTKRGNNLHLVLNDLDRDYFRDSIQLGRPKVGIKEKKSSHERMRQAFVFFDSKLRGALANYSEEDKVECLDGYFETFKERFNVLYMEATELEEAFVIFETLNARGRDLETADLLKNYIFRQSKEVQVAQKKWNSMVVALGKADPTKYIRHFWNSNHEFERDKTLYRAISKNIKTSRRSRDFLAELERCASYYHSVAFPDEDTVFQNEKLIAGLKALKTLKAKSFYPVVLAMEQQPDFSEADIAQVVFTIETYMLRNFTICGKVANESERFFASTAKGIYDGDLDTVDGICNLIRDKMVNDEEFRLAFVNWSASKSEKEIVRYILSKIHRHLDDGMELNLDTSTVHIEHIMPIDLTQWKEVTPEIHETCLWRLGNLMLLSGIFNRSASNRPFSEKKVKYLESKIEPNRRVSTYSAWGEAEIIERQSILADYAVKIWGK